MNKRVLVLTGTTDILRQPNETDNTMEEVFDLTLPSKQRYVKKYGYDLLSLRSFGKDRQNRFTESDIGFLRVLRAFELLENYDIVMWIDADSIITNHNFSIDDFQLDEDHCFYASWDWMNKASISTGNFIIQKTNITDQMFSAFLHVAKYVKDTNQWGWEQTTMNLIYRQTDLGNHIKVLDHKFLNSIPTRDMFIGKWGSRPIPYPWTSDSFLSHITGICNNHRIEILTNSFKDYL